MKDFIRQNNELYIEDLPCTQLAARFGTPLYVYARAVLTHNFQAFQKSLSGFPALICYAVKANSNIAVLNVLARLGSGFDIVSGGELARVLAAGGDPEKIVFSGVGKLDHEIEQALKVGIACINIESEAELAQINRIATHMGIRANIAFRVNPNIDPKTHPYITTGLTDNKFGVCVKQAQALYKQARSMPSLNIVGLACHIGSQITTLPPFLDTFKALRVLYETLTADGISIRHIDVGGGVGIPDPSETNPLTPATYVAALRQCFDPVPVRIILAPGRAIVGSCGILLTRVIHVKQTASRNFAIVDCAMNDFMRPALYQAWHPILPVIHRKDTAKRCYDVVGPVCETGDFMGKARDLRVRAADLLAIGNAGAYGFSMSSQYNARPRAAEVIVDHQKAYVVRERETEQSLFAHEHCIPSD